MTKTTSMLAIFVVIVIAGISVLIYQTVAPTLAIQRNQTRLQDEGRQAEATVESMAPTATLINDQPVARIWLRHGSGNGERRAEVVQIIPIMYVPLVQAGMRVPVRVDAADADNMIVDIARLGAYGAANRKAHENH